MIKIKQEGEVWAKNNVVEAAAKSGSGFAIIFSLPFFNFSRDDKSIQVGRCETRNYGTNYTMEYYRAE